MFKRHTKTIAPLLGLLLVWVSITASRRHVLPEALGNASTILTILVVSSIMALQLCSVLNQMRCIVCGAIFRRGILRLICEHRVFTTILGLALGLLLGLELLSFVALVNKYVLAGLIIDAFLFVLIYKSVVHAGVNTFTDGAAQVGRRIIAVFLNYAMLYAFYAIYSILMIDKSIPPLDFQIYEIVKREVNFSWVEFEWYVRTKYMIDLAMQSLTNISGVPGIIVTIIYLMLNSLGPFIAISILYRFMFEKAVSIESNIISDQLSSTALPPFAEVAPSRPPKIKD